MAGMFSPEMVKLAQEQMANMTPEQMQAMQNQVLCVSCPVKFVSHLRENRKAQSTLRPGH